MIEIKRLTKDRARQNVAASAFTMCGILNLKGEIGVSDGDRTLLVVFRRSGTWLQPPLYGGCIHPKYPLQTPKCGNLITCHTFFASATHPFSAVIRHSIPVGDTLKRCVKSRN